MTFTSKNMKNDSKKLLFLALGPRLLGCYLGFFFFRRNNLANMTNDYFANCLNDPVKDPYCPIFRVGDIMKAAEPDQNERRQMLEKVRPGSFSTYPNGKN